MSSQKDGFYFQNKQDKGRVSKRIIDLQQSPSSRDSFNTIGSPKLQRIIAETSLICETEADKMLYNVQEIENVEDLQEKLLYKGEEALPVKPLPITEMRTINSKTGKYESVRYGLEATITNHRLIILDKNESSIPRVKKTEDKMLFQKLNEITVEHEIVSSLTYFPVVLTDVLGITIDVNSGSKTIQKIKEKSLIPVGFGILLLSIILGFAANYWLFILSLGSLPFMFLKMIKKDPVQTVYRQDKTLKLAIINPENKNISKIELDIPLDFPISDLIEWIKVLQLQCPILQHSSEMHKNLNITLN